MASPQVAGTAALILAAGDRPVDSLRARILANVDRLPSLAGLVHTGGRLDVCAALPGCQPSISIDSSPPRYTNSPTSTFTFSSDDPEARIRCRLATELSFQTCGSTKTYAGQGDGTYRLRVFAIDPAGHRSAVKSRTWTVDGTAPVASIDSGPTGITAQTKAVVRLLGRGRGSRGPVSVSPRWRAGRDVCLTQDLFRPRRRLAPVRGQGRRPRGQHFDSRGAKLGRRYGCPQALSAVLKPTPLTRRSRSRAASCSAAVRRRR